MNKARTAVSRCGLCCGAWLARCGIDQGGYRASLRNSNTAAPDITTSLTSLSPLPCTRQEQHVSELLVHTHTQRQQRGFRPHRSDEGQTRKLPRQVDTSEVELLAALSQYLMRRIAQR